MEVKRHITLLSMTPNPGELIEKILSISYVTQRFGEKIKPKMIKFKSGRQVPYAEFKLGTEPTIGQPLPGYKKDDVVVAEIIPASYVKAVKFAIAIGHTSLLRNCHATFMFENITRKGALHFLRYGFVVTNFQSQKYKNQGDFQYVMPERDEASDADRVKIRSYMATIQRMYEDLRTTGIDPEWSRCVYPNNIAQTMTFTTNFEQIRHMCDCLCDDDYVSENQVVMMDILRIMKKEAPEFFFDFHIREGGVSAYRSGAKYSRNKKVNWSLPDNKKAEFGLDVPQVPGQETEIA